MNELLSLLHTHWYPLPGEAAHRLMAPYRRTTAEQVSRLPLSPRESAVMILLYTRKDIIHLVLIKRNTYEGVHSAQVSLPGGRQDSTDPSLTFTALRETFEEIGIEVRNENVIGQLSPLYIPPSNFLVTPYLAAIQEEPVFRPDPREVNYLIEIPLLHLLDESLVGETTVSPAQGIRMKVPCFTFENEIVWGATAAILCELKLLLKRVYPQ